MKRLVWLAIVSAGALFLLPAQDINIVVSKEGDRPRMAIPDFRGSGEAQTFMGAFNQTLWADMEGSGLLKLAPKTMYPLNIPQQPADFQQPSAPEAPATPPARGRQSELVRPV